MTGVFPIILIGGAWFIMRWPFDPPNKFEQRRMRMKKELEKMLRKVKDKKRNNKRGGTEGSEVYLLVDGGGKQETEMSRIQRKDKYLATNHKSNYTRLNISQNKTNLPIQYLSKFFLNADALATEEGIYRETEDLKKEASQFKPPKDFHKINFRFDQQDSARPSMNTDNQEEDKEDFRGATTVRRDFDHEDPNVENDYSGYGQRRRKVQQQESLGGASGNNYQPQQIVKQNRKNDKKMVVMQSIISGKMSALDSFTGSVESSEKIPPWRQQQNKHQKEPLRYQNQYSNKLIKTTTKQEIGYTSNRPLIERDSELSPKVQKFNTNQPKSPYRPPEDAQWDRTPGGRVKKQRHIQNIGIGGVVIRLRPQQGTRRRLLN